MTHHEQPDREAELSPEELDATEAEQLPAREAMSIIDPAAGSMPPVPVDELDVGTAKGDPTHGLATDDGNNAA